MSKIVETYKTSEPEAVDIYKATLRILTPDGTMSRELQESIVDFQRKQFKVEKNVPPENVYDFSLLRSVHNDVRK